MSRMLNRPEARAETKQPSVNSSSNTRRSTGQLWHARRPAANPGARLPTAGKARVLDWETVLMQIARRDRR
jgi:hypothetical protein